LGNTPQGTYALADLPPGTYRVQASRPDYQIVIARRVNHLYAANDDGDGVLLRWPDAGRDGHDKETGAPQPGQVIFHRARTWNLRR
jgi:hypothetical protein